MPPHFTHMYVCHCPTTGGSIGAAAVSTHTALRHSIHVFHTPLSPSHLVVRDTIAVLVPLHRILLQLSQRHLLSHLLLPGSIHIVSGPTTQPAEAPSSSASTSSTHHHAPSAHGSAAVVGGVGGRPTAAAAAHDLFEQLAYEAVAVLLLLGLLLVELLLLGCRPGAACSNTTCDPGGESGGQANISRNIVVAQVPSRDDFRLSWSAISQRQHGHMPGRSQERRWEGHRTTTAAQRRLRLLALALSSIGNPGGGERE